MGYNRDEIRAGLSVIIFFQADGTPALSGAEGSVMGFGVKFNGSHISSYIEAE
jgi:hypothetical protein